jgi:hypothetical protein
MKSMKEHYENFASTVDLDGLAFTVEHKNSANRRLFWLATFLACLFVSIYFTGVFINGYIKDTPYTSTFDIHAMNAGSGLAPFPDILICTSAPWDPDKMAKRNVSRDLVSYLTNYLFPFVPYEGLSSSEKNLTLLAGLEAEHAQLVDKSFGGNTMHLLNNITLACDQIVDFCIFGFNTFYNGPQCCANFFQPAKFGFVNWCLRTNEELAYKVREAGSLTGILISMHLNNSLALNPAVINRAASVMSGVTSFGVAPPQDHTFLTMSAIQAVGPATTNTLTLEKSSLDQTGRSSFLKSYTCLDNADDAVNAARAPGYPAYTRENCELMAKQAMAARVLNCSLIYFPPLPGLSGLRYCSPRETTKFFTNLR